MWSVEILRLPRKKSIPYTTDLNQMLRLPRKMTMEVSKVLRLPQKMQLIFSKGRKSIALATQNDFRHVCRHMRMLRSATPATQNHITTCFDTVSRTRIGFATSSIDTARPEENQRLETRHVGASKQAFRARLPPTLTLCSFKIDVFLRVFL